MNRKRLYLAEREFLESIWHIETYDRYYPGYYRSDFIFHQNFRALAPLFND